MENVTNENDIKSLKNNEIRGKPTLINSSIRFSGKNNIFFCESNVKLINSNINFNGDNCVIFISHSYNPYVFELNVFNDSVIYIGKDNFFAHNTNINIQEHQNLIIGDDSIFGFNLTIRSSDAHPIFSLENFERVNHSKSVYIGDHVWIGPEVFISRGAEIGSGCVIESKSYIEPNSKLKSNGLYRGNPAKLIRDDVFLVKEYVGAYKKEDTESFDKYESRIYDFSYNSSEALDPIKIDSFIEKFDTGEKFEFLEKLFVKNKKKDRFSI